MITHEVFILLQGNITLSLSTAQSGVVGNATLKDFTLRPGDNNLPMTAVVDEAAILKSQNASGFVTMHITGVAAVFNSQHIPYYVGSISARCPSWQRHANGMI